MGADDDSIKIPPFAGENEQGHLSADYDDTRLTTTYKLSAEASRGRVTLPGSRLGKSRTLRSPLSRPSSEKGGGEESTELEASTNLSLAAVKRRSAENEVIS